MHFSTACQFCCQPLIRLFAVVCNRRPVIRKSDNRSKDCNPDHPSSDCALVASVRPADSLLRTDRPDARASSAPAGPATTQDAAAVPGRGARPSVSSLTTGIAMIIGIVASIIIVLLLLALAVYKYRSRDEGTYRVDESKNYGYDACNSKPLVHLDGRSRSSSSSAQSLRQKRKESHREWYV